MRIHPPTPQGADLTRIVIASDQFLVGEAVRVALLSRGFAALELEPPVGVHGIQEFARRVGAFRPAAGLLLCELEGRRLVQDAPHVVSSVHLRWVVLTRAEPGPAWGELVEAGAVGVVPMTVGLDDLAEALTCVVSDRPVMTAMDRDDLVAAWRSESADRRRLRARLRSLTPREIDVLELLSNGQQVRAIAEMSGVSEATVRSQVKSILRKLEVQSQLAAVAAYRHIKELLPRPPP